MNLTTRLPDAAAFADGPAVGLAMIDGPAQEGVLASYPYLYAAQADLLRRLGRHSEAASAYRHALGLTSNRTERTYLERRLRDVEVTAADAGPGPSWS